MHYDMFLFRTSCRSKEARALSSVPFVMKKETHQDRHAWEKSRLSDVMLPFSATLVKQQIEAALPDLCRVSVCCPPQGMPNRPFLSVVTSYRQIKNVFPQVYAIAAENGLLLYDAEREKIFYRDLLDENMIDRKNREQELHQVIRTQVRFLWDFSRIDTCDYDRETSSAFVVTLQKEAGVSLETRVQRFYDLLASCLQSDETLSCKNKCFTIRKKNSYAITFCLEAYKKQPNLTGFMKDGKPCTALLHRMGCVQAFQWLAHSHEQERSDVSKRMQLFELKDRFKNPADRFVQSVNIAKQLRKEWAEIRYTAIGPYGSDILFHVVPDEDSPYKNRYSVLMIEEEEASFLLPFVQDVYPYIYERYYLTENYLPLEMWLAVLDRLQEAKELILHDTFHPKLKPYLDRFNLYTLPLLPGERRPVVKDCYYDPDEEGTNSYQIRHAPAEYLYKHRFQAVRVFDVLFAWWKEQMHCPDEIRFINIQGP